MRAWVAGVALVLVVGCGGGGDSAAPAPSTTTTTAQTRQLRLTVEAEAAEIVASIEGCEAGGDLDSIREGTRVVVKDQAGKVLGTAALPEGYGFYDSAEPSKKFPGTKQAYCRFELVMQVPPVDFYQVQVGGQPEQSFSKDDAATRLKLRFHQS